MIYDDHYFMQQALHQAQMAFAADEVPIGAILVIDNKIIARGFNQVEQLNDPTAHAEMLAITAACNSLRTKYLPHATLYVTIEPCHMCAGALYWSKIKRIVYGAKDDKQGYHSFCRQKSPFHPKALVTAGIMQEECAALIISFFKEKRK